jgi:hypothetical protein
MAGDEPVQIGLVHAVDGDQQHVLDAGGVAIAGGTWRRCRRGGTGSAAERCRQARRHGDGASDEMGMHKSHRHEQKPSFGDGNLNSR